MNYTKDFSVIIPCWRGAAHFLPILLNSIPEKKGIEIIVVDNSKVPLRREEIVSNREIVFLHSAPERHAGGSRNDGIAVAKGRWLLFADADDYFTTDAFEMYYSKVNTNAEIVYTAMGGKYADSGENSDRGDKYALMVHQYCSGEIDEMMLRVNFSSPCCKMVSHALVDRKGLRYDEIRAGNDSYFSLTSGYYANKIDVIDKVTYVATVNHGSLTQRRDFEVVQARLYAKLKCNKFLKKHGLPKFQKSVMSYLYEARHYKLGKQFVLWMMLLKYKQNPFIGWWHWGKTLCNVKAVEKCDSKYRVM